MSYHGMGTAAATSTAAMAAAAMAPAVVPARTVQTTLYERGIDLAVDGVFGPQSVAGLNSVLGRIGRTTASYAVSADRRSVVFHNGIDWSRIQSIQPTRRYSTSSAVEPSTTSLPAPAEEIAPMPEESGADVTPWLVGAAVAAVGVGGYFYLKRRQRLAANRRRRMRRR